MVPKRGPCPYLALEGPHITHPYPNARIFFFFFSLVRKSLKVLELGQHTDIRERDLYVCWAAESEGTGTAAWRGLETREQARGCF